MGRRAGIDWIGAILERAECDTGLGRDTLSLSMGGRRRLARGAGDIGEIRGLGTLGRPGC